MDMEPRYHIQLELNMLVAEKNPNIGEQTFKIHTVMFHACE